MPPSVAHASRVRALYQHLVRPALFRLDAETAHHTAALGLRALHASRTLRRVFPAPPSLAVHALGRTFANPVGIAAGFDKGAEFYNALGALGFGAVEIGTVTAHAQPGNPRPRLFRLPEDRALVNRMGFNNPGADAVAMALRARPADGVVLGVNLGKTKVTPLEQAPDDYAASARALGPYAHYVVINVSSPNTPGLRSLQSVEALRPIVQAVQRELAALPAPPPLLVKIAPDLADDDIDAVADLALELKLAGLIATNTTIARAGLGLRTAPSRIESIGAGGLSGAPLRPRSLAVIRRLYARTRGALVVVGVGGIETADDAWDTIRAGATLVQVYTGFIYRGPTMAHDLVAGLARKVAEAGLASITDAVGADAIAR